MELPDDHEGRAPEVSAAAGRSPGRADADDVIEMGGRPTLWPGTGNRRMTAGIAVAVLVAGLLLGYLDGHLGARRGRPATPTSATPVAAPPALTGTGNRCAVQRGKILQLGIQVVNQSGGVVTLLWFRPVLPLGGLQVTASAWGTCRALPEPGAAATLPLDAGAAGWLTISFDVLVRCPGPLPVMFAVSYLESGRVAGAELDGFPDLGQIHYTGCRANR